MSEQLLQAIIAKCEQYWNADDLCMPEVHAALAFIHQQATALAAQPTRGPHGAENICAVCYHRIDETNPPPRAASSDAPEKRVRLEKYEVKA